MLGPINFGFQKMLGPKRFEDQKDFGPKNMGPEKEMIWKEILVWKEIWVQLKFSGLKNLRPRKVSGKKKL